VVLLGERKTFVTALIVPDFEQLWNLAKQHNLPADTEEELVALEPVKELFRKELREFSKQLASHEKVRDFRLLTTPFTIETGELTPTLKVKRKVIEKKYAHLIDELYAKDVD
jgi:long-chain acyl-CoA synthetase